MTILDRILDSRKNKTNQIYDRLQIRLAYESNAIEGNEMSLADVESIWFSNSFMVSTVPRLIQVEDIIETTNHFEAVDYILDTISHNQDHKFVKELHRYCRHGTIDEKKRYPIGAYKTYPNVVGGRITSEPHMVHSLMEDLLDIQKSIYVSIADFHARFEHIHPFQDGNGRVGRLLLFRQCIRQNSYPSIIEKKNRYLYYKALDKYNEDPTLMRDLITVEEKIGKEIIEES